MLIFSGFEERALLSIQIIDHKINSKIYLRETYNTKKYNARPLLTVIKKRKNKHDLFLSNLEFFRILTRQQYSTPDFTPLISDDTAFGVMPIFDYKDLNAIDKIKLIKIANKILKRHNELFFIDNRFFYHQN